MTISKPYVIKGICAWFPVTSDAGLWRSHPNWDATRRTRHLRDAGELEHWVVPTTAFEDALITQIEALFPRWSFPNIMGNSYCDEYVLNAHHDGYRHIVIVSVGAPAEFYLQRSRPHREVSLYLEHGDVVVIPPGADDLWSHGMVNLNEERYSYVFRGPRSY